MKQAFHSHGMFDKLTKYLPERAPRETGTHLAVLAQAGFAFTKERHTEEKVLLSFIGCLKRNLFQEKEKL